jgi:hypothetical protein
MEAGDIAEKLSRFIWKQARLVSAWKLKFFKIRVQKIKLRKVRKNLERRMSRLGSEFYSLHHQGETEFLKSLVILQQIKIVEEAESQLLAVQDRIEAIEEQYRTRREAIISENARR